MCFHRSHKIMAGLLLFVAFVGGVRAQEAPRAQSKPPSGPKLHTPPQIMKIVEQSKLTYVLKEDEAVPPEIVDTSKVLVEGLHIGQVNNAPKLVQYPLSTAGSEKMKQGEAAFGAKDYDTALKFYMQVPTSDPGYVPVLTLIGDAYFCKGDYDSAKQWFNDSLDRNFLDFQTHWFLADVFSKQNDPVNAIREATTAHALNIHHKEVKSTLVFLRGKAERPWKEWSFVPRMRLSREADRVRVEFAPGWKLYALVQALWKYESGYAESMGGPDPLEKEAGITREKEALMCCLTENEGIRAVVQIVEDGFLSEFVLYEILAKRDPGMMLVISRENLDKTIIYIDTYH